MKYQTLLFDADNTLFDFDRGEEQAFHETFAQAGISVTPELFACYQTINADLWRQFEQGKAKKDVLVVERFQRLSDMFSLNLDPVSTQNRYLSHLSMAAFVFDGAYQMLTQLKERYNLYIITNGVATNQHKRLAASKLDQFFQGIIVSEEVGFAKPSVEFFDYTFSCLAETEKSKVLVIGDSLSADIQGANNYGLDSIWFNPKGIALTGKAMPTYTVKSFGEILEIL